MINRLIDAQEIATNSVIVSDLLDRMTRYARDHLIAEKKMMAEHGYPQLEKHKAQHMAFIKKTIDFCIDIILLSRKIAKDFNDGCGDNSLAVLMKIFVPENQPIRVFCAKSLLF